MRGVGVVTRVVLLREQIPRAASNGGTIPRGEANKSLTTDTPVGIKILTTDESGRSRGTRRVIYINAGVTYDPVNGSFSALH